MLGNLRRMTCGIVYPAAELEHGDGTQIQHIRTNDGSKRAHFYRRMRRFARRVSWHGTYAPPNAKGIELHNSAPTGAQTAIYDPDV